MTLPQFKAFCAALQGATEDYPFDDKTLTFKVGGKLFALTDAPTFESINLKCDPELALELRAKTDSVRPGYHMNKKHWNTIDTQGELDDDEIKHWIRHSYQLVWNSLSKKQQKAIEEQQL
jgi:predicted DNA-binding protein (MmcQ/YjbR family)